MFLRRSPSSSPRTNGRATGSRSSPNLAWMRRSTRAASSETGGQAMPLLSPRSDVSSENDQDTSNKSPKSNARSILRRSSMPAMSTSPTGSAATAKAPGTATRRTTRRQSMLMSKLNSNSPTSSPSATISTTPHSKPYGMTLRSARKRGEQPTSPVAAVAATKAASPLQTKLRKSISFLTPPSQSKKSRSSTGCKKTYKKTPLPAKKKKSVEFKKELVEIHTPPSQSKKSRSTIGRKKTYKKTPLPSKKKKSVEFKKELVEIQTIAKITEDVEEKAPATGMATTPTSETDQPTTNNNNGRNTEDVVTIVSMDEVSFLSAVQGTNDYEEDEEEVTDAETVATDDSLAQATAAVQNGIPLGPPAMNAKDASWAKLPVEGEVEDEEELSLMEEAITFVLNNKHTALLSKKNNDYETMSEEEEEDTALSQTDKKGMDFLKNDRTEEKAMDDIPSLVESSSDVEPLKLFESDRVEEECEIHEKIHTSTTMSLKKTQVTEEVMDWTNVVSLLMGAMMVTTSLALTTMHLNGSNLWEVVDFV